MEGSERGRQMKCLRLLTPIVSVLVGSQSFTTTYYLDLTNGNYGNNGTSKTRPWKHAPGTTHQL